MKLLEKLAKLEHDQWVEWSKSISTSETISSARLERWKTLWIPYSELTEEQKEQDRVYARKVLKIIDDDKCYCDASNLEHCEKCDRL